ncbi:MAG: HDOD domain-containing protein [Comamonadaceae bacterium]
MTNREPTRSESDWVQYLDQVEIPVLRRTTLELARLRENEDKITPRDIAPVLLHDPMFTLRVLRHLQSRRRPVQQTDITTVQHALMMLGITPFFSHFTDLPVVESTLASHPSALSGLMRVVFRAHHAALYARDWADLRQDARADEVAIAALMHDLTEMLLWCFAPEASLRTASLQQAQASLRSKVAQDSVFGFNFSDIQVKLIRQWTLAPMLQDLIDDSRSQHPRTVNVALAIRLARHSADSWDNAALPDDYAAIQQFLKLPQSETLARIQRTALAAQSARDWYHQESAPTPPDLGESMTAANCAAKPDLFD